MHGMFPLLRPKEHNRLHVIFLKEKYVKHFFMLHAYLRCKMKRLLP